MRSTKETKKIELNTNKYLIAVLNKYFIKA